MKAWCTELIAINPDTEKLSTWGGPTVYAPTMELAQEWCRQNRGYLTVIGELIEEVPIDQETGAPDFENAVDYTKVELN